MDIRFPTKNAYKQEVSTHCKQSQSSASVKPRKLMGLQTSGTMNAYVVFDWFILTLLTSFSGTSSKILREETQI